MSMTLLKTFNLVRIYLLPSRLHRYRHLSPTGKEPWALVTGASDGIGKAFSHELAKQEFNVVLHGRNEAKLTNVMSDLHAKFPDRSFRILVADGSAAPCASCARIDQRQTRSSSAAGPAPLNFEAIKSTLEDLHLTILINNAGGNVLLPVFGTLSEYSTAAVAGNISLNALFPMHLIRTLLPALAKNSPSLVINISSLADQSFPLLATYSASKQFLMALTTSVRLETMLPEINGQVEILGIRVGKVTGVSHLKTKPSLFVPDTHTLARAALDRAGYGHGVVVGYWLHALQQSSLDILPSSRIIDMIKVKTMIGEREEELKRH